MSELDVARAELGMVQFRRDRLEELVAILDAALEADELSDESWERVEFLAVLCGVEAP
jgi:hypothetical protein